MYFTRRHLSSWKGSPAPLLPRALHAAPRKRGVGGTRAIAHSIYNIIYIYIYLYHMYISTVHKMHQMLNIMCVYAYISDHVSIHVSML